MSDTRKYKLYNTISYIYKPIHFKWLSFNKNEKIAFLSFTLIIICSFGFIVFNNIQIRKPHSYSEGIIGFPRFINPILASNDPELDVSELTFASLINDLTEPYKLSEDKKTYTLCLKKGLQWHDTQPITADDIVFTIQAIQNPYYKSPLLPNFQDVTVKKLDNYCASFKLKTAYSFFPSNLDIGIMPKHIWQNIKPNNFALNKRNFQAIGNGEYKVKKIIKNKQGRIVLIELKLANTNFAKINKNNRQIKKITLKFYQNETKLIKAFAKKQINGISHISGANLNALLKEQKQINFNVYNIEIPRYFALFFNNDNEKSLSIEQRKKLASIMNKQNIIQKILSGHGKTAGPDYDFAFDNKNKPDFLNNIKLTITLPNYPDLVKTARLLKAQWQGKGAEINLDIVNGKEIQNKITNRNYESILFGQLTGRDSDAFAFWHSTQKQSPGLNLSCYDSPQADAILVQARQTFDQDKQNTLYTKLTQLLKKDLPAIFIYNPDYLYIVPQYIKGIELNNKIIALPCKRFANIAKWQIYSDADMAEQQTR